MDDRSSGVNHPSLSRRAFLNTATGAGVAAAAMACAPAASPQAAAPAVPPAAPPARAAWVEEWDKLVSAAKGEGKLSVFTVAGAGYRKWMEAVQAALPGITVEHQSLPSSDQLPPKIVPERKAGVFSYDVLITSPVIALPRLRPEGVLDDLRPLLFRPDVLDDKAWSGGFEAGWLDNKKLLGYALADLLTPIAINTDIIPESEARTVQDMLNPKWKGKIVWQDVRAGSTFTLFTSVRLRQGEEMVKRLVVDQEAVFSRDTRQITEGLVRGRYAMASGILAANLQEFWDAGLGKNVKLVDIPDVTYINNAFAVWAVNRPPHPNVAKMFVNWVLTKAGLTAFSANTGYNARRLDVPVVDPNAAARPGQYYLRTGPEDNQAEFEKTQQLLNDLVGIKN